MTHEHLSDEQLSAHLDGEPDETASAATADGHLDHSLEAQIAACDTCRQRLALLGEASALVRVPVVAVPPSVRAAAVEAALAQGTAPDTGAGPETPVVSLATRRSSRPTRILAVAAAVAAVLVVSATVPLALLRHPSPAPSAARSAAVHPAAGTSRPAAAPTFGPGGVRSLGSVASVAALKARLGPALSATANGLQYKSTATSSGALAPQSDSSAATTSRTTVPPQFATCVAAAQASAAAGTSSTLALVATATYRHTPALVVVVRDTADSSTGPSGQLAVVVARSDCRVLERLAL
jgi:hypothetical protein